MSDPTFSLRYDGRDAAKHRVDMRLLGQSFVGAERIISDMAFVAIEGRLPKRRERLPIAVLANTPEAHCFDIGGAVIPVMGILPFAHEVLVSYGANYVSYVIAYVLALLGGKPKQADVMLQAIIDIHKQSQADHLHEMDAMREHSLAHGDQLLAMAEKLRPAARQLVAPVGPSCEELSVGSTRGSPVVVVDVAMADAIRAQEELIVDDMQEMFVTVDGVIKHSRTLKVEVAGYEGRFVSAEVRDPVFEQPDNVYQLALSGGVLRVMAKATYRLNGEMVKLHIMDAQPA